MELYTFSKPLFPVTVLHRPSKIIKSPYVADVQYEHDSSRIVCCHTSGLGCSGLVETSRRIYVCDAANSTSKTTCTAHIAECEDNEGIYYVGVHPMISQKAATSIIQTYYPDYDWKSEIFVEKGTRLDFVGNAKNGKQMYIEVKNAMISHECTKPRAERHALFPDGFRKKKTDPISPRAIKHAETLTKLAQLDTTDKCMLLYIVPRNDCRAGLVLNSTDPAYCKAVRESIRAGVIIRVFALDYNLDGSIHLFHEVPFYLNFCDDV